MTYRVLATLQSQFFFADILEWTFKTDFRNCVLLINYARMCLNIFKGELIMKYKVLVIDDDIAILRLIQNVLENKNFLVDTRTSIPEIDICHFIGYDVCSKA